MKQIWKEKYIGLKELVSGMKSDMNEGDMELTQKSLYMIEVVNKEKPAGKPSYYYTKSYYYERSFGKWIPSYK
ncbi:hypothetical protein [Gottfriedia acidiceleris]|uniref:Uncharacterized protein n=1 Tax=Gottfriedia acidiceleris TaxID=371036 RepID=A0ABY4JQU7_9BACI|nr:hypothetical protein [Gottfriedia acidiceleris]UPM55465.1 hypothetical protein MY490_06385 [Gottfriedia acidiceleris]